MSGRAELELVLERRGPDRYALRLRFTHPESDADVDLSAGAPTIELDRQALSAAQLEPKRYGSELARQLQTAPEVREGIAKARAAAASLEVPLRVRLSIGASAPELHELRWEALWDAEADAPLFVGEHTHLSRYLGSRDWRPVRSGPRSELAALLVVANPSGLDEWAPGGATLAPIDVEGELARAREALGDVPSAVGPATLEGLIGALRETPYDILYLVAHGALVRGEPRLWLCDAEGGVDVVAGSDLERRLATIDNRPRLVVLASCQSAGSAAPGAHAALGPRLAQAGIGAVVAMQGDLSMETAARFMPALFAELQKDGAIDRALAVAREAVLDRPDWWMPVLFMRLKTGRLWYTAGFGEGHGLEKWPALVDNIEDGAVTPILGPGLSERLVGARSEVARRWAEDHHYPMEPHQRDVLAPVAQFLAASQDRMFPRRAFVKAMRQAALERRRQLGAPDEEGPELDDDVDALLAQVWRLSEAPHEPHRVLARLPLPVFVTTNPDTLLEEALSAEGKAPRTDLCRWNRHLERKRSLFDREPDYEPTVREPLVFHLFGLYAERRSLVLTEDDHLDFLIGVTRNHDLIPAIVREVLADSALVFLGFQLDDQGFRLLLRSLLGAEGRGARWQSDFAHVAAQLDPDEDRVLSPERTRTYLERYFADADISLYWGTVDDFVAELERRRRALA